MDPLMIFEIIVIVFSIVLHEVAHGYAAYMFGDKTAYYNNRLTLNPIPHIDIVGSILVPVFLIFLGPSISILTTGKNLVGNMVFGWAKPVPVNEASLNPYKLGSFCVSIAGVFTNFLLAIVFVVVGVLSQDINIKYLSAIVAMSNLSLTIFNLIPLAPADGYRILSIFLHWNTKRKIENYIQQYFLPIMIASIFISTQIFQIIFPFFSSIVVKIIFN